MDSKRVIRLLAASMLSLSILTACGEDAESSANTAASEAATESATEDDKEKKDRQSAVVSNNADLSGKKVGVCVYQFSNDFMTLYRSELQTYLESIGFDADNIEIVDAANDQATQTNQIRKFIDDEVDVLIVNPVDPMAVTGITDDAVSEQIPLIYISREPDETEQTRWTDNGWDVTYVGCDARESGTMQGEIITALENQGDLNGDGKVSYLMIGGDADSLEAQYRTEYSIQVLQNAGLEATCLANEVAYWDKEEARDVMASALEEYGTDIEVVFCNNDTMALGALEAIQDAGRIVGKDIYLVGVDALKETCEDILAGTITGTVFNDYIAQSHAAADAAVRYIQGAGNEHYIGCDYFKVTAANAQDILDSLK